ncbi:MAG: tyrosine-type recombinase/integrase [Solirubrobacteraceae bacterium]
MNLALAAVDHFLRFVGHAGLRLSELVALDLDDARVSGRKALVVVRSGKGDVYREVPLNAPARKALDDWLKKRPAPAARAGGEPLFVSRAGGRLSARSVDDAVRKLGRTAGIELSAHVYADLVVMPMRQTAALCHTDFALMRSA